MRRLAPLALLALFAVLAVTSMARLSVTGDEVTHLPAGYTYVATGDFRLNMQHPPLMKALAGLPLLALDLKPVESTPGWQETQEWRFGKSFLTDNRVPMSRIVFLGRLPMVATGLLLGAVLFLWARSLWGDRPALFVLFLFALSPNLLAHAPIVHTDAGVACFNLLTVFLLWRFARSRRLRHAVGCGAALGLALLAKYSGVVSAGIVGLLVLAMLVDSRAAGAPGGIALARVILVALLVSSAALVLVAAGFGFPHGIENYYRGFTLIHADANPHWEAFLWGFYSKDGFWYYYLLAQAWKTPLPTLLCFVAALLLAPLKEKTTRLDWCFLLLPIAAFHLAGMLKPASIGVRHVLPAFPFLFLCCGATAWWVGRRGFAVKLGFALLCVWYAAGTLRVHPYYLSYFNELAGGPEGGAHYLDDSNIEWGQAYYELKRYLDETAPEKVRLLAFEPIDRRHYGIEAETMRLEDAVWPEPGVTYVVGASYLQRNSLFNDYPGVRLRWLERYEPVTKLGWSLYVFRFSTDSADAGDATVRYLPVEQWYADAIDALHEILVRHPGFDYPRRILARVKFDRAGWLDRRGEAEAALDDYVEALAFDPETKTYRAAFRAAVDRLTAALPLDAEAPVIDFRRASAACQAGHQGECVRALLRTVKKDARHLPARLNLGAVYRSLGLVRLARAQWEECLRIDPGYAPALHNLRREAAPGAESGERTKHSVRVSPQT
jgi:tetratricopeptide (TPR) repeat protein